MTNNNCVTRERTSKFWGFMSRCRMLGLLSCSQFWWAALEWRHVGQCWCSMGDWGRGEAGSDEGPGGAMVHVPCRGRRPWPCACASRGAAPPFGCAAAARVVCHQQCATRDTRVCCMLCVVCVCVCCVCCVCVLSASPKSRAAETWTQIPPPPTKRRTKSAHLGQVALGHQLGHDRHVPGSRARPYVRRTTAHATRHTTRHTHT